MEQKSEIILKYYLNNNDIYNTDYKIVKDNFSCIIYYKNIIIFIILNNNYYTKYNIFNNDIEKEYVHNRYLCYFNNKNYKIIFFKKQEIKAIRTNTEFKYYNKNNKFFKKFITVYSLDIYFRYYYYNIKQHIYKINNYPDIYNKIIYNLYSNHYSIMFYILFIFDI